MEFDSFVLAASTTDLGDERRARERADAVEFRMDGADHPLAQLGEYDGDLPVIATNRVEWEGGEAADSVARLDALADAATIPAVCAVDVELRSLRERDLLHLVELAHDHDTSIIASFHDFSGTPSRDEMGDLLASATERGDIGKLAVTAETRGDVLSLLSVTNEFADLGAPIATMAMGEAGRHSRAVAPLYGSVIGYAPVDAARATAPGQYDLETLSSLIRALR